MEFFLWTELWTYMDKRMDIAKEICKQGIGQITPYLTHLTIYYI